MIPPKYSPPLPIRFWRGDQQYEIRAAPCGHRYVGSCNGEEIAVADDPAVVMWILVKLRDVDPHKKRKGNY